MNEFRENPIIQELLKSPRGEWVEIEDLIANIDPGNPHLEAFIFEQVELRNLERDETRVRLSMKLPRLKP